MINVTFFGHVLRQQLRAKGSSATLKSALNRPGIHHYRKFHGLILYRVDSSIGINQLASNGLRGYSCIIDVMIRRHLTWLQSPGATIVAELVAFAP
jgi:hypothetical protein